MTSSSSGGPASGRRPSSHPASLSPTPSVHPWPPSRPAAPATSTIPSARFRPRPHPGAARLALASSRIGSPPGPYAPSESPVPENPAGTQSSEKMRNRWISTVSSCAETPSGVRSIWFREAVGSRPSPWIRTGSPPSATFGMSATRVGNTSYVTASLAVAPSVSEIEAATAKVPAMRASPAVTAYVADVGVRPKREVQSAPLTMTRRLSTSSGTPGLE